MVNVRELFIFTFLDHVKGDPILLDDVEPVKAGRHIRSQSQCQPQCNATVNLPPPVQPRKSKSSNALALEYEQVYGFAIECLIHSRNPSLTCLNN